jgi:4-alpha-glucanotransferase
MIEVNGAQCKKRPWPKISLGNVLHSNMLSFTVRCSAGGRMKFQRSSGILLHPTSFPGPYGVGDLGKNARRFIDFLADSGCKLWQVLPLGPTGYGDSPYQCFSAFAGNPYMISPDLC